MSPGPEALQLIVTAVGSGVGAGLAAWGALKSLRQENAELRAVVSDHETRVAMLEATMDRRARAYIAKELKTEKDGE